MNLVLSIIIPVYNVEKYISKTLDSIFSQPITKDSVEVIVVNDGTKDNSMSIVNKFALEHEKLTIINQENGGLSAARNTGLRAAKGKYVWFVDSDDWIEKNSIQPLLGRLESSSENVLMYKIREYDEDGNVLLIRSFHDNEHEEHLSGTEVVLYQKKYGVDITPIQQFVISRDFLLKNNLSFVRGIYHEDKEFAPRMLILSKKVSVVPKVLYCYLRRSSGSITTDSSLLLKRTLSKIEIYKRYEEFGKKLFDKKERQALSFCRYGMASYIWNYVDLDFIKEEGKNLDLDKLVSEFKHDVWKNLFYDRNPLHLLRHLLFLVSPTLLKKLHKNL